MDNLLYALGGVLIVVWLLVWVLEDKEEPDVEPQKRLVDSSGNGGGPGHHRVLPREGMMNGDFPLADLLEILDDDKGPCLVENGKIWVMFNDTFHLATADGEKITVEEVPLIAGIWRTYGKDGLIAWAIKYRNRSFPDSPLFNLSGPHWKLWKTVREFNSDMAFGQR